MQLPGLRSHRLAGIGATTLGLCGPRIIHRLSGCCCSLPTVYSMSDDDHGKRFPDGTSGDRLSAGVTRLTVLSTLHGRRSRPEASCGSSKVASLALAMVDIIHLIVFRQCPIKDAVIDFRPRQHFYHFFCPRWASAVSNHHSPSLPYLRPVLLSTAMNHGTRHWRKTTARPVPTPGPCATYRSQPAGICASRLGPRPHLIGGLAYAARRTRASATTVLSFAFVMLQPHNGRLPNESRPSLRQALSNPLRPLQQPQAPWIGWDLPRAITPPAAAGGDGRE